jgi:hypothetical protein
MSTVVPHTLVTRPVTAPAKQRATSLQEQLLELRSVAMRGRRDVAIRAANSVARWRSKLSRGPIRLRLEAFEASLRKGDAVGLAEIIAVEDLLRSSIDREVRNVAILVVDGVTYYVGIACDDVVTIARMVRGECQLIDRGRLSRTGHIVQVGGADGVGLEVYSAIEKALRGWWS